MSDDRKPTRNNAALGRGHRSPLPWIEALVPQKIEIPAIITLATAALYFVGNHYQEAYFGSFNIPPNAVLLPLAQYLLSSVKLLFPYAFFVLFFVATGKIEPDSFRSAVIGNSPLVMIAALLATIGMSTWATRIEFFTAALSIFERTAVGVLRYMWPWKIIFLLSSIVLIASMWVYVSIPGFRCQVLNCEIRVLTFGRIWWKR